MSRLHEGTQNDKSVNNENSEMISRSPPLDSLLEAGVKVIFSIPELIIIFAAFLRIRKFIRARHQLFRDSDQKPTSHNDGIISAL